MQRGGILWSADYMASTKARIVRAPVSSTPDAPTPSGTEEPQAPAPCLGTPKNTGSADASHWPHDATTVMLRNIPNRYTQEDLLEEMNGKGFHAAFDYFHLVMDMRTKRNKGFAFLNFRSPVLARQIHAEFNGFHLQRYKSQKVLEVALAEVQGLHANAISYLNAHGDRVQNVWFKPIIFVQAPDQPDEWKAIPLTESNLPLDIARVYGSTGSKRGKTRTEQRQRVLTSSAQAEVVLEGWSPSAKSPKVAPAIKDDPLVEGEFDEITKACQAFLVEECGGANKSNEALLAALDKPRRKHKAKKGITNDLSNGDGIAQDTIGAIGEPVTLSMMRNGTVIIDIASSLPKAPPMANIASSMPMGPCQVLFEMPSAYHPVLLGGEQGRPLFSGGLSPGLVFRPPPGLSR